MPSMDRKPAIRLWIGKRLGDKVAHDRGLDTGETHDIAVSWSTKILLNDVRYKIGLQLARIKFVRTAIDQRADLSEFRKPPTIRIFLGMFLIAFSFLMCWPAISTLGGIALYFHRPWIFDHLRSRFVFFVTSMFSGRNGAQRREIHRIFFKWLLRCGVEKLLSFGKVEQPTDI